MGKAYSCGSQSCDESRAIQVSRLRSAIDELETNIAPGDAKLPRNCSTPFRFWARTAPAHHWMPRLNYLGTEIFSRSTTARHPALSSIARFLNASPIMGAWSGGIFKEAVNFATAAGSLCTAPISAIK